MDANFPTDPKALRRYNLARYKGVPPSWDLIEKVLKKSGLQKQERFASAWMMARCTLTWYKNGEKPLPAKYWHIFYEFEYLHQMYAKPKRKQKRVAPNNASILPINKKILDDIQARK